MKYKRISYYILFFLSTLLLFMGVSLVFAQDSPADVKITWVDTSQFPQIQVYLVATSTNSNRYAGLFVDALEFFEDGSQRSPSMYDSPRGTSVTFLVDADQFAEAQWNDIRQAIEEYVDLNENWMDEDYDRTSVIVATDIGEEYMPLVEETSYRNDVFNAFITSTGAYYTPSFKQRTPLNDLIKYTLDSMPGETSRPGMYRALVLFSGGDAGASQTTPEGVIALANEMGVPIFTIQIGQNPGGELSMQQLANNTGGQHYVLDVEGTLIPLWQVLSSHRQQYVISYQTQIVSSGSHNVKVQVTDSVQDSANFDITILSPEVEITFPESDAIILRTPPESSENPADFEPKTQSIKYHWSWPDGLERKVTTIQLRVNGAFQEQLDLTTSDDRSLVWDISNIPAGPYSLRVDVIDELGLTGSSLEIPVIIEFDIEKPTPEPTATVTPTPRPPITTTAYNAIRRNLPCIAGSGLGLTALLAGLFAFSRRMKYMGRSP
ncbi:MAG: VWA domain-containing protein, partial [Anaerolineales bacterium]|nr:VWA domain-containing protein [Anaerolineales bacterium]